MVRITVGLSYEGIKLEISKVLLFCMKCMVYIIEIETFKRPKLAGCISPICTNAQKTCILMFFKDNATSFLERWSQLFYTSSCVL